LAHAVSFEKVAPLGKRILPGIFIVLIASSSVAVEIRALDRRMKETFDFARLAALLK